jgi:hypothetical protein
MFRTSVAAALKSSHERSSDELITPRTVGESQLVKKLRESYDRIDELEAQLAPDVILKNAFRYWLRSGRPSLKTYRY